MFVDVIARDIFPSARRLPGSIIWLLWIRRMELLELSDENPGVAMMRRLQFVLLESKSVSWKALPPLLPADCHEWQSEGPSVDNCRTSRSERAAALTAA